MLLNKIWIFTDFICITLLVILETMEDKVEIIRSPAALNYQLVFFTVAYALLTAICIYILIVPFRFFDANVTLWFMIFILIAIILYLASIAILKHTWQSLRYYLAKDCLVITSGVGGNREDLYRYENITSSSLRQTNTQKTRGYAQLVLQVKAIQQPIILKDVIKPNEILEQLQDHITKASQISSVR